MADGPDNYETGGTYTGPLALLKGERAQLIVYRATGRCLAQFERQETGYGVGYHDFGAEHFALDSDGEG